MAKKTPTTFAKRQREMDKKRRAEEKRKDRAERKALGPHGGGQEAPYVICRPITDEPAE